MLQCHPYPNEYEDPSKQCSHCAFFMGLQRKQGVKIQEGQQFDIRGTVDEFRHEVNMYMFWKPGMELYVSHVRRKQIPCYVFPEGYKRPRPARPICQQLVDRTSGEDIGEECEGGSSERRLKRKGDADCSGARPNKPEKRASISPSHEKLATTDQQDHEALHKDVTLEKNGPLDENANVSLSEVIFNDSVDVRANSLKESMAVEGTNDCVEASCGNDKDENARKLTNGSSFLECGEASAGDLFCNSEMIKVDLEQFAGSNCTIVGGSQELLDDDKQGTIPGTEHLKNGSAQNGVADVSEPNLALGVALEARGGVTADAPQKPALRHVSVNTKFLYFADIDVLFSLSTPALLFSFSILVSGGV
ncbi:hypothetical protein BHE74_00030334 [Ensete ventricosum]|nr:hypothetical protein BHE74_00030334 [Ensete ventricosum]